MISDIDKRFMNNKDFLCGITALYPEDIQFLNYEVIEPLDIAYFSDCSCIKSEFSILKKALTKYEKINSISIKDIYQFHSFLKLYEIAFSEIYK